MGDADEKVFNVGSRKSQLALLQTHKVIDDLKRLNPNCKFNVVEMATIGDKILDKPLAKIGDKGLFTKELEEALERGNVDFLVHSLKDLPTTLPEKKIIGAVLKRLDARDCVILHKKHRDLSLKTLPAGSIIGTSSLRRTAQLNIKYPHLKISNIRGNLNTRLRKLEEDGAYDGIVLATAGVIRMGWQDKISEILDESEFLYAVGQGALAIECQEDNYEVLSLVSSLIHRKTILSVIAERSFLRKLEGGCSAPVAVNSTINDNIISLTGLVSSLDGREAITETLKTALIDKNSVNDDSGEPQPKRVRGVSSYCGICPGKPSQVNQEDLEAAEKLGIDLAELMIKNDALRIIMDARKQVNS